MLRYKAPGSFLVNNLIRRATHTVKAEEVREFLSRYAGQDAEKISEKEVKRALFDRFKKDSMVRFNPETNQLNIWVGTQLFTVGKQEQEVNNEQSS